MLLTWLLNLIMPQETKICRVCGKTYKACRTSNPSKVFRWQDITCSPECGEEYLRRIRLSRGASAATAKNQQVKPSVTVYENKKVEEEKPEVVEEIQENEDLDSVEE